MKIRNVHRPYAPKSPNPLKLDPTRTTTLRREWASTLKRRFRRLRAEIRLLVEGRDVFGLRATGGMADYLNGDDAVIVNAGDWQFRTSTAQVDAFRDWLRGRVDASFFGSNDRALWEFYVRRGYERGLSRSYDDAGRARRAPLELDPLSRARADGSRGEFLRTMLHAPESVEKVQLLTGRVLSDLEGITKQMEKVLLRTLADGLVRGVGPEQLARELVDDVEGVGELRAELLARTETIRAHAEGQLDALETLGVTEVGVQVEFSTAGDERVCPECSDLEGKVMSVADAHGIIPVHPRCRCAFIPANVGEENEKELTGNTLKPTQVRKLLWNDETGGDNCGVGPGGFQPGNTCSKGGSGSKEKSKGTKKSTKTKKPFASRQGQEPNPKLPEGTRPQLTDKQQVALNTYTKKAYEVINRALRTKGEVTPKYKDTHKALQNAFARAPVLDQPIPTTRRMLLADPAPFVAQMTEAARTGGTVEFKGYVSTSTEEYQAISNIQLRINAVHGLDAKPYSAYPDENELTLNHGSRFLVRKVEYDAAKLRHVVHLDQLPPEKTRRTSVSNTLRNNGDLEKPTPEDRRDYWVDTDASFIKVLPLDALADNAFNPDQPRNPDEGGWQDVTPALPTALRTADGD